MSVAFPRHLFRAVALFATLLAVGGVHAQLQNTPSGQIYKGPIDNNQTVTVGGGQKLDLNRNVDSSRHGPQGKSASLCGGQGQPQCPPTVAQFVGDAVGACPPGSFADVGAGGCYSCPPGFIRSAEHVDGERACAKADSSVKGGFQGARFIGSACPKGSFFDPIRGGECWTCPAGLQRSLAHVEAADACVDAERFARASRTQRTIWPHDCKGGSFHDVWDGGGCWTCPAGFVRTGHHIADERACSQKASGRTARASRAGQRQCGEGQILDPRNGGECWTCPTSTTRTVFPIQEGKACETWAGFRYAKAQKESMFSCGSGNFFDAITSKDPNVQARVRAQYQASPGEMPAIGNSLGGTCWVCPAGAARTTAPVWSDGACQPTIVWQPAPYRHPGLFGLNGADQVVADLLRDRKLIDTIAAGLAESLRLPPGQAIMATWEEIVLAPQDSSVLKVAVLSRIQNAVTSPQTASAAERRLAQSFADAIRNYRTYIAQNALDAYDSWVAAKRARSAQMRQDAKMAQIVLDLGEIPDFDAIAAESIVGGLASGGVVGVAGTIALLQPKVQYAIFPTKASKAAIRANIIAPRAVGVDDIANVGLGMAKAGGKIAPRATLAGIKQSVGKAVAKMAASIGKAVKGAATASLSAANIGPQLIVGIAVEMAVEAAIRIEAQENARPTLLAKLASAQQPVDLARLMLTEPGVTEFENQWTLAMGGEDPPLNAPEIAALARAAAQSQKSTSLGAPNAPAPTGAANVQPSAAKVAGAITRQVDAHNAQGHSLVELVTVVPLPNVLTPVNLKSPGGIVLVSSSQDAAACPVAASGSCKQRFSLVLDPRANGCSITGEYVAEFDVGCQKGMPAAQCQPGRFNLPFKLAGSSACKR